MSHLTDKDRELARRYIVIRMAIKGFTRDKAEINEGSYELRDFYLRFIENALLKAHEELLKLRKYPIQIQTTDQPTVYQVTIGSRIGYIEMNVVEIEEEISNLFGVNDLPKKGK